MSPCKSLLLHLHICQCAHQGLVISSSRFKEEQRDTASGGQVGSRAERMGLQGSPHLYLYSATRLVDILQEIVAMQPRAVVIDSIQTVYLDDVNGSAGSVSQVWLRGLCCGSEQFHSLLLTRGTNDLFQNCQVADISWPHEAERHWRGATMQLQSTSVQGESHRMQVRECATALLHVAKRQGVPVFLVGHVTKTGDRTLSIKPFQSLHLGSGQALL